MSAQRLTDRRMLPSINIVIAAIMGGMYMFSETTKNIVKVLYPLIKYIHVFSSNIDL